MGTQKLDIFQTDFSNLSCYKSTSRLVLTESNINSRQSLLCSKACKLRKLAEYCFVSTVSEWALRLPRWVIKNSVSSWPTTHRPRGTHWALSPELGENQTPHWAQCLKPCSSKPYSGRLQKMTEINCLEHFVKIRLKLLPAILISNQEPGTNPFTDSPLSWC